MRNPDFNCEDDGSGDNCEFDPGNIVALNTNPNEANAYYEMKSLDRLHMYFTGLSQALEVSAIAAALSMDDWAETSPTF